MDVPNISFDVEAVKSYPLSELLSMYEFAGKQLGKAASNDDVNLWDRRRTFITEEIRRRFENIDRVIEFCRGTGISWLTVK